MKTRIFLYLLFVGMTLGCSDEQNETGAYLTIRTENDSGELLTEGSARYRVSVDGKTIGEYVTNGGKVSIMKLPMGSCVIQEVAAPYGYQSDNSVYNLTISDTSVKDVVFKYHQQEITQDMLPGRMQVSFWDANAREYKEEYTAIRIGEYYWINTNFTHSVPAGGDFENRFLITQGLLDTYLDRARLDKSQYQLADISDFDTYYGRYYSRPSMDYLHKNGHIHNTGTMVEITGWGFPSSQDFRQLFAMCPFSSKSGGANQALNECDVRFALSAQSGDNPLAYDIQDPSGGTAYKTYWFDRNYVTNIYSFNMMPGGAHLNGDSPICNGLGPDGGCYDDAKKGDIYGLFYTASFAVRNDNGSYGAVTIHDCIDTHEIDSYHLRNVRWCRRMTNAELGYKLYINAAQTDIKKLDIDQMASSGYSELPNGYLRGFYVQYMLDNDNADVTVSNLVRYANQVEDPYVK